MRRPSRSPCPRSLAIAVAAVLTVLVAAWWVLPAGAAFGQGPGDRPDPALADGLQWNLTAIGAPSAWPTGTGAGVRVAVVDSGIDADHPDLADRVVGGADCTGSFGDPQGCRLGGDDRSGHGTHVAGILGATAGNGIGVSGVAPDVDLLAVRVLDHSCLGANADCTSEGAAADVVSGIRWAVDNGAQVINLSLAPTGEAARDPSFDAALREAWARDVIVVVASGNQAGGAAFTDEPVLVVTALSRAGERASYAQDIGSARWGLAAPGGEAGDTTESCRVGGDPSGVISTFRDPGGGIPYACLAGTSMAAPHVSGAAAILLGLGLTPEETVDRLLGTARDLSAAGPDPVFGAGSLDLAAAVAPERRPGDGGAAQQPASLAGEPGEGDGDRLPVLPTTLAVALLVAATTAQLARRQQQELRSGADPGS